MLNIELDLLMNINQDQNQDLDLDLGMDLELYNKNYRTPQYKDIRKELIAMAMYCIR